MKADVLFVVNMEYYRVYLTNHSTPQVKSDNVTVQLYNLAINTYRESIMRKICIFKGTGLFVLEEARKRDIYNQKVIHYQKH